MTKDENTKLFEAIKNDNIELFSSLITKNENISFGRFPLLTLCYLYKAKTIIKDYEKQLLQISKYVVKDYEPFEIYKKFKIYAGRTLRLYSFENIVTPIEMLAIMHKDSKVKRLFKENNFDEKIINNLKTIYTIFAQKVEIENNYIKIKSKPLSCYNKYLHRVATYVSLSFVVLGVFIYFLAGVTTGIGTNISPYIIYNETQLYMALKSNGSFKLAQDITLNSFSNSLNFSGVLDGDKHTIYINELPNESLINNNFGKIKNLNLVYNNVDKEISNSVSLFCNKNTGIISNVSINCPQLNLTCYKGQKDIFVTSFVQENYGRVTNCNLLLKSQLSSSGEGKCSFGGFVSNNYNTVEDCIFDNGSCIESVDVDIAGIVANNNINGTIKDCYNYAKLSQTNNSASWSPNTAGIVLTNKGLTKNCYNFESLQVISNSTIENEEDEKDKILTDHSIYLGGICARNFNKIDKCINKGNIISKSNRIVSFIGGIVSYSVTNTEVNTASLINASGVDCKISYESNNEKAYVFVGGLAGFLNGKVSNCYSLATMQQISSQSELNISQDETEKYFVGSCIGLTNWEFVYVFNTVINCSLYMFAENNSVFNNVQNREQIGACITVSAQGIIDTNGKVNIISVVRKVVPFEKVLESEGITDQILLNQIQESIINKLEDEIKEYNTKELVMNQDTYWEIVVNEGYKKETEESKK